MPNAKTFAVKYAAVEETESSLNRHLAAAKREMALALTPTRNGTALPDTFWQDRDSPPPGMLHDHDDNAAAPRPPLASKTGSSRSLHPQPAQPLLETETLERALEQQRADHRTVLDETARRHRARLDSQRDEMSRQSALRHDQERRFKEMEIQHHVQAARAEMMMSLAREERDKSEATVQAAAAHRDALERALATQHGTHAASLGGHHALASETLQRERKAAEVETSRVLAEARRAHEHSAKRERLLRESELENHLVRARQEMALALGQQAQAHSQAIAEAHHAHTQKLHDEIQAVRGEFERSTEALTAAHAAALGDAKGQHEEAFRRHIRAEQAEMDRVLGKQRVQHEHALVAARDEHDRMLRAHLSDAELRAAAEREDHVAAVDAARREAAEATGGAADRHKEQERAWVHRLAEAERRFEDELDRQSGRYQAILDAERRTREVEVGLLRRQVEALALQLQQGNGAQTVQQVTAEVERVYAQRHTATLEEARATLVDVEAALRRHYEAEAAVARQQHEAALAAAKAEHSTELRRHQVESERVVRVHIEKHKADRKRLRLDARARRHRLRERHENAMREHLQLAANDLAAAMRDTGQDERAARIQEYNRDLGLEYKNTNSPGMVPRAPPRYVTEVASDGERDGRDTRPPSTSSSRRPRRGSLRKKVRARERAGGSSRSSSSSSTRERRQPSTLLGDADDMRDVGTSRARARADADPARSQSAFEPSRPTRTRESNLMTASIALVDATHDLTELGDELDEEDGRFDREDSSSPLYAAGGGGGGGGGGGVAAAVTSSEPGRTRRDAVPTDDGFTDVATSSSSSSSRAAAAAEPARPNTTSVPGDTRSSFPQSPGEVVQTSTSDGGKRSTGGRDDEEGGGGGGAAGAGRRASPDRSPATAVDSGGGSGGT